MVVAPSVSSRPAGPEPDRDEPARTGHGIFAGIATLLLLVAFTTTMNAGFWSPKAAVLLIIGAVGLPKLVGLLRTDARLPATAAIAFLGWATVATIFSGNRAIALLGRYDQGTGLIFIACLVGAWALGVALPESGRRLVEWGVLVGALINAAVAVLQAVFDLSALHLERVGGRSSGLLGNAVHLGAITAAALAFVAPRVRRRPLPWMVAAVLLAMAVQLSGSRSGLVVIAGVLVWALFAYGWQSAGALVLAVGLGLGAGSLVADSSGGHTAASRASDTEIATPGGEPRLRTWRTAIGAVADRPLVGVGPGRFDAATSSRRTFAISRSQGPDQILTDGHNLIVEYATTTGVPGALALAAFLGLAAWRARGPRLVFALGVLAVGLTEPQFVATTGPALLVLGTALPATAAAALPVVRPGPARAIAVTTVALASVAAAALLVGDWHLQQAALDFTLPEARSADRLLRPWPEPAGQLAKVYLLRSKAVGAGMPRERTAAVRARTTATKRNPTDPKLWNDLGELELSFGLPGAAEGHFRTALERNPWSARALNGIGRARIAQHDPAGARPYFEKSLRVLARQPAIRKLLDGLNARSTP